MNVEVPLDIDREERRRWAARQLQLPWPDEATAANASVALLRLLPEEDWLPPEPAQAAWAVLNDEPAGWGETTPADLRDREAGISADLDAFANLFYEMTTAERARQIVELDRRAAPFPRQAVWLRELSRGVKLDLQHLSDPDLKVDSLVRILAKMFTLRPAERAVRWQQELPAMVPQVAFWEAAAHILKVRHPQLAALLPKPLQQLSEWRATDKRITRARRVRKAEPRPVAQPAGRPKSSEGNRAAYWLLWFLIYPLIKLMSSGTSCTSPTHSYTPGFNPALDYSNYSVQDAEAVRRGMQILRDRNRARENREAEPEVPIPPPPAELDNIRKELEDWDKQGIQPESPSDPMSPSRIPK